jgi:outer membrane protein
MMAARTANRKTTAILGFGPSVSVNGNAGRNEGNSFNQQQGQVVNGVVDFIGANINASIPLVGGLTNFNSFRSSESALDAQAHLVKRTSQDVIRDVANQYLTCLLDQRLVSIQEKNLETQKQTYDQIKAQVEAGSTAEVDLYNQEYLVKNAELLYLRSRITLRNDMTTLAQTIQIDPLERFSLEEPEWDLNLADQEIKSLEELNTTALEQRSDLAQAQATEQSNKFNYQSFKGNFYPTVSMFAQYGSQYNYVHEVTGQRTFEQQFAEDNTQLTYGLSFRIPILGGFQSRSSVVRNKVAYDNSKLTTKSTEIVVKSDVIRAQQNYQDARTNYSATLSQMAAAERSYSLEKERYDLGISDIVALTQASQNYNRAQADLESA